MIEYRKPLYLSPSSLAVFEEEPDEFFRRYIIPKHLRPERSPQTDPMSVGSAFDALIKNHLYKLVYGEDAAYQFGYGLRQLIEKQCEPQTLPESLVIACDIWEHYKECGALGDLVADINQSSVLPQMEFDVTRTVGGVPLLGKPDLHYRTLLHAHVIADFKVSGSCSKHGVSPQQGYKIARDVRGSATNGKPHKKFSPTMVGGQIVSALPMNETTTYWADQLCTYAWALGEPVGSQEFICRIEQIACRPHATGLRVKCVTHEATVAEAYQHELLARYQRCWDAVQRNHIWVDLSEAESRARGELLVSSLAVVPSTSVADIDGFDFSF